MRAIAIVASLVFSLVAGPAQATMEGRGRIFNADGGWCWFTQTVEQKVAAFIAPLRGSIATMVFDDPGCMAERTEEGLDFAADFNREQIAGRIAGLVRISWVTEDTVYDPGNRYLPGRMQAFGECMVADDMPATAIAINFVSNGTSITKVEYAHVFGCGNSL